ncbi:YceD family protein [Sphingomicrobium aestuariivivum]|uniref:YceD family protein n=1 Tax=Sphingomicrobium aestuariivivum TaxID=1582356 RepID=UPI001FD67981|nr:DUF177 domain-containing protein [Sphingomicrobium aestuariivivum]MCJ8191208.1 DUF177 domain-containing protein [Sphingomicrobium aestuariivivum]
MIDDFGKVALATLKDGETIAIHADEAMRASVAERLHLPSIEKLAIDGRIERDGDGIAVNGTLSASVTHACVATGDPVAETIEEHFGLLFAPHPEHDEDAEIELGVDDLDTIFHDGRELELGDALIDTLALALDPYPRVADADARLKAAGVLSEEEAGAFGALAGLKKKLEAGGKDD